MHISTLVTRSVRNICQQLTYRPNFAVSVNAIMNEMVFDAEPSICIGSPANVCDLDLWTRHLENVISSFPDFVQIPSTAHEQLSSQDSRRWMTLTHHFENLLSNSHSHEWQTGLFVPSFTEIPPQHKYCITWRCWRTEWVTDNRRPVVG